MTLSTARIKSSTSPLTIQIVILLMDTIKTFFNNSTKETSDDREPYTSSSSEAVEGSNQSSTTKTSNASGASHASSVTAKSSTTAQGTEDFDSDVKVLSPVTHEHHHKKIIDENQTIIDRDHNVDHYKKKIQPVQIKEAHDQVDAKGSTTLENKKIDHSDKDVLKQKLAAQSQPRESHDEEVKHETIQKADRVNDKTHHHMHEAVQPVIEKDVYDTEIRHNKKLVHEDVEEQAVVEETETLPMQTQRGELSKK